MIKSAGLGIEIILMLVLRPGFNNRLALIKGQARPSPSPERVGDLFSGSKTSMNRTKQNFSLNWL